MNKNTSAWQSLITQISFFGLLAAGYLLYAPTICLAASPGSLAVSVQTGVRVKMRDGISLVADVYRPAAPGKFPALLQRPDLFLWQEWAVAFRDDAVSEVLGKSPRYRRVKLIEVKDSRSVEIYRRVRR